MTGPNELALAIDVAELGTVVLDVIPESQFESEQIVADAFGIGNRIPRTAQFEPPGPADGIRTVRMPALTHLTRVPVLWRHVTA